jgi:hypothetical protein
VPAVAAAQPHPPRVLAVLFAEHRHDHVLAASTTDLQRVELVQEAGRAPGRERP